jgi:hypothetical protein
VTDFKSVQWSLPRLCAKWHIDQEGHEAFSIASCSKATLAYRSRATSRTQWRLLMQMQIDGSVDDDDMLLYSAASRICVSCIACRGTVAVEESGYVMTQKMNSSSR